MNMEKTKPKKVETRPKKIKGIPKKGDKLEVISKAFIESLNKAGEEQF